MWKAIWNNQDKIVVGQWYSTCTMDEFGEITNEQDLKFENNLWWNRNGTYIYYTPTHFK